MLDQRPVDKRPDGDWYHEDTVAALIIAFVINGILFGGIMFCLLFRGN